MRFIISIVLGLCALVSARCGTKTHENIAAMHAAYQLHEAAFSGLPARRQDSAYTIKTYFYVITENDTIAGGYITEETIDQQVGVIADLLRSLPAVQSLELISSRCMSSITSILAPDFHSPPSIYPTSIISSGEVLRQAAMSSMRWRAPFAQEAIVIWTFISTRLHPMQRVIKL